MSLWNHVNFNLISEKLQIIGQSRLTGCLIKQKETRVDDYRNDSLNLRFRWSTSRYARRLTPPNKQQVTKSTFISIKTNSRCNSDLEYSGDRVKIVTYHRQLAH